jgi:hypothetical protein
MLGAHSQPLDARGALGVAERADHMGGYVLARQTALAGGCARRWALFGGARQRGGLGVAGGAGMSELGLLLEIGYEDLLPIQKLT